MAQQGLDCSSIITETIANNLKAQAFEYVARYLGTGWKCMQKSEANIIIAAGLQIISIYETNPTSVSYFSNDKGKSDAVAAVAFAQAIGQPAGTAIYFTVDYNAPSTDFSVIGDYLKGIQSAIGSDYHVGIYGKYDVMEYAYTNKLAEYFWQTYAWSAGKEASDFIHIYQYQDDVTISGLSADRNEILKDPGAWGAAAPQPVPVVNPTPAPQPAPVVVPDNYIVQAGDTLSGICAKFGLNMTTVEALNHITKPDLIFIGQVLHLKHPVPTPTPPQPSAITTYTIKAGDTLSALAIKFGTTVAQLKNLNHIEDEDMIFAGQVIKVPGHSNTPVQPATPTTYTVQKDDTLLEIAAKFHTTLAKLMELNRIANPDRIFPGQVLKIK